MLFKKTRTEEQIEASRRNGAESRGPVTTDGKARAARNSYRHGFRSSDPYAALGDPNIDRTLCDEFKACLFAEYELQTSDEVSVDESAAYIPGLLIRPREIMKRRVNAEIRSLKRARPELSSKEHRALAVLALAEIGFCTTEGQIETRLHVQPFPYFDRLQKLPRKIEITNEPDTSHEARDLRVSVTRAEPWNPAAMCTRGEPRYVKSGLPKIGNQYSRSSTFITDRFSLERRGIPNTVQPATLRQAPRIKTAKRTRRLVHCCQEPNACSAAAPVTLNSIS